MKLPITIAGTVFVLKPITMKITPKNMDPNVQIQKLSAFICFLFSVSSNFIKKEVKTGLITNATNKELDNTIIKVIGRYFMNSPMMSFQKINGKKAARVVAVEAIIGIATSPTPSLEAVVISFPSCNKR